jgi:hypothetical protein
MREQSFRNKAAALFILLGLAQVVSAQTDAPAKVASERAGKEVVLPERITRVPSGNDFNNSDSEFCYQRSKSSDNLVLFWAKEYGDDPAFTGRIVPHLQRFGLLYGSVLAVVGLVAVLSIVHRPQVNTWVAVTPAPYDREAAIRQVARELAAGLERVKAAFVQAAQRAVRVAAKVHRSDMVLSH